MSTDTPTTAPSQPTPPVADRLIDNLIADYITTNTGIAAAGYGHLTDHDKGAQHAIDAMRYLHLAGWDYRLTPRIVEALRRAGLLASTPTAAPWADEAWREYTVEGLTAEGFVLCRSHEDCEELITNKEDRYLTLGQAVEWAKAHAAAHARMEARDAAPVVPASADDNCDCDNPCCSVDVGVGVITCGSQHCLVHGRSAEASDGEQDAIGCGHAFVGDAGEFTCRRFAGHDGNHWDLFAEFGWSADAAPGDATGGAQRG